MRSRESKLDHSGRVQVGETNDVGDGLSWD